MELQYAGPVCTRALGVGGVGVRVHRRTRNAHRRYRHIPPPGDCLRLVLRQPCDPLSGQNHRVDCLCADTPGSGLGGLSCEHVAVAPNYDPIVRHKAVDPSRATAGAYTDHERVRGLRSRPSRDSPGPLERPGRCESHCQPGRYSSGRDHSRMQHHPVRPKLTSLVTDARTCGVQATAHLYRKERIL